MIRTARPDEFDRLWPIFSAVVSTGDTYAFEPTIDFDEAKRHWMGAVVQTYVAERAGAAVGTYILKPNQPGLGAHVANAAFMVAPWAQGQGVGRAMAEHCLEEARGAGYRAMQFNLVVSTNDLAIALWRSIGFRIVGTLPAAYRHAQKGYVDAHIMYRSLVVDSK